MHDAVNILEPALDKFYGLLSDDQKAKVTALVADQRRSKRGRLSATHSNATRTRSDGLAGRFDRRREADRRAADRLKALQDAATKAADILKSSCAAGDARTPPARLAAVQTRLDSMLQAIGTVRPALDSFYNSLNDEQKAAFDAIGPERNGIHTASPPTMTRRRNVIVTAITYGYNIRGMIFRMMGL